MMRKGRILSGAGSVGLHAVLSLGLALLVPLTAWAASTHTPEQEYADLTKVDQAVSPLGDHPFGARIGLYDGSLSFLQTDVSLAGNGPTLSLSRAYIVRGVDGLNRRASSALGDWQLALPRLETLVPHQGLAGIDGWMVDAFAGPSWYRCRDFAAAPTAPAQGGTGHREWTATDYWQGYQLIVPGHG
ncbi:MAG TPA: hypothetical protein VFG73_11545, partial [Rhodanobacteraceae bacterium]|nr:hypothetical protein [Rhodanobacteraceae bacterium]